VSGSAGNFGDRNVVRPKEFERSGAQQDGGGHDGGGGGGSDMTLLARVAKLESDVEHIRRDIADMKVVLAIIPEIRANLATLLERTQHLATREWVMWRLFGAFLLLAATMTAVVGYAPRLQAIFGTAPATSIAAPR
jgi:hypothetical protein